MTRVVLTALLLAACLPSMAEIHSSVDVFDGRRVLGWVWDSARPTQKLTVHFAVDRKAGGRSDFSARADRPRPDLEATPYRGCMFDGIVPARWRDGRKHSVSVWVTTADGRTHALHGSPKAGLALKVLSLPRYKPQGAFPPIRREAEIWYGAEATWAFSHNLAFAAFREPEKWPFTSTNVQVIDMHNNIIAKGTREQLQALKDFVDKRGLKVAAEMAGLSQWMAVRGDQFGEESAKQEMAWSKLWLKPPSEGGVGGHYDYLMMDDPIYRGLYPNDKDEGRSIEHVANELADAILVWRTHNPEVQPVLVSNFPNWAWKGAPAYFNMPAMRGKLGRGEYLPLLARTVAILKERGTPLHGVLFDNPYDYGTQAADTNQRDVIRGIDYLDRVIDAEKTVRAMGLKVGHYFNTDIADIEPEGVFTPPVRARAYYEHVMMFIDEYRRRGGDADFWLTYSWMKEPLKALPESEPYTMTWNAKQIIRRLRGLH